MKEVILSNDNNEKLKIDNNIEDDGIIPHIEIFMTDFNAKVINNKTDCHSGKQKHAQSDKVLFVGKKEISKGYGNVGKP